MHATIRTYSGGGAFADALAARESDVREVISAIGGFRAYYLIRTADGTATVSVFDDQAGAEESTRAAAAWTAENMPDAAPGPPQVTAGEVLLSF